jgi:hypothetical protein
VIALKKLELESAKLVVEATEPEPEKEKTK